MAAPKNDLWKHLDSKAKTNELLGDLERHLAARPAGDRSTTVLHPSEIIKKDFCQRGSYFLLSGHKKIAENPPLRLQVIFDEGHYIHAKWQRWFQEMGIIHGKFKCEACDKITFGTSPESCEHCGAPWNKLIYDEVTMIDDALRIKGHTDGWVKKHDGDEMLIEIKSIGPGTLRAYVPQYIKDADGDFMKAWGNVKRPFGEHVLQGQMYLELMQRMGNPVEKIVFIYELKADNSYKFFTVKRDFELVRHIFDRAAAVVAAVEAGVAPDCTGNPLEYPGTGTCKQCAPYKEN
jgi:hypothetical protein